MWRGELDDANVITAVLNLSGNLELIGWTIGANGTITRWSGSAAEAGAAVALLILGRGVVETLLAGGALGVLAALVGASLPN